MSDTFSFRSRGALIAVILMVVVGCGDGSGADYESPLADIEIVGIDFVLDSILLTNADNEPVRTQNLTLCQGGDCFDFNIFTIAPRATVIFSVSRVGGVDPATGEIALHDSAAPGEDPLLVDYVAWGEPGQPGAAKAGEELLWNENDFVPTDPDTLILTKTVVGVGGSDAWEAGSGIP